jgi:uncharacterized protein YndB with AHSA1/START domain
MATDTTQNGIKQNIVVTRLIDAPVERVWQAWSDPELVMKWWGPQYFTSPLCKMDFCEGGKYVFGMRAPADQGGYEHYTSGVYRRIVPMELIEFTQSMSDRDGNRIDPSQVGMPAEFPEEIRTVITFTRVRGDMTELAVTEYDWTTSQMYIYSIAGLHQSIDKLIESLK